MAVDVILVPQGAEYSAVVSGLKEKGHNAYSQTGSPIVYPIPIGKPVLTFLQNSDQIKQAVLTGDRRREVLLLGLGGSLSQSYQIGDVIIARSVVKEEPNTDRCSQPQALRSRINPRFVHILYDGLRHWTSQQSVPSQVGIASCVTCDRIIHLPEEKEKLGRRYEAELVDMEASYVLDFFRQHNVDVGVVRVISDDCGRRIPNLNAAITADGSLDFMAMTGQFVRQPIAALNLIQGSLAGLRCLKTVSSYFCSQ